MPGPIPASMPTSKASFLWRMAPFIFAVMEVDLAVKAIDSGGMYVRDVARMAISVFICFVPQVAFYHDVRSFEVISRDFVRERVSPYRDVVPGGVPFGVVTSVCFGAGVVGG